MADGATPGREVVLETDRPLFDRRVSVGVDAAVRWCGGSRSVHSSRWTAASATRHGLSVRYRINDVWRVDVLGVDHRRDAGKP